MHVRRDSAHKKRVLDESKKIEKKYTQRRNNSCKGHQIVFTPAKTLKCGIFVFFQSFHRDPIRPEHHCVGALSDGKKRNMAGPYCAAVLCEDL